MGVQHAFGTVGATGGGYSAFQGLQPAFEDMLPGYPCRDWQCRAARTWKDRNKFVSLWSRGQFGGLGNDGSSAYIPVDVDYGGFGGYEPYSCDGEGTSISRFLRGFTKDSVGVAVANAIVQGFQTATDAFVGQVASGEDGTYTLPTDVPAGTQHYLVAYKAGSPDTAGTTVNTLTPTNVDGT